MPPIDVRPFRRSDREQLTAIVNRHIGAVLPGVTVSVNAVMSQLEREPGEIIVDPWVVERMTLVAIERERVVAGAHLLRYGVDDRVGPSYRDTGEIRWLVCEIDHEEAGDVLAAAAVDQLERWGVDHLHADVSLPAPCCYGVTASWPHLRRIFQRAGFVRDGHEEVILLARVDDLPTLVEPPVPGLAVSRRAGLLGTRFSATLGDREVGFIEVDTDMTSGGSLSRLAGWADVGNLHVAEELRRRGIATWLVGAAADWLRLARIDRLIAYCWPDHVDEHAFLLGCGWRELTRTERGWSRARASR